MNLGPAANVGLRGEYRVILNPGTDRESDSGWMPNLITTLGMDSLASDTSNRAYYCSVGTGAAAPANTDTALQAFVASQSPTTATLSAVDATSPYQLHLTSQYQFAQGAVVANIAELGVGSTASGTNLFSRCLIVDGAGAPTALTVTAIDQLTVYYRLNVTYDVTDRMGAVTLAGSSYAYTARACSATSLGAKYLILQSLAIPSLSTVYNGTKAIAYPSSSVLGPLPGTPTGSPTTGITTQAVGPYTAGSFYRDVTVTMSSAAFNPAGGIGALIFQTGSNFSWQYQFTPPIPKDNTKTLSLTFRVTWARA